MSASRPGQIAATEFVTITPDATLGEAAQLMREHEVDHVVVTDGAKRPVGMLSTLDIASVLARSDA